jgi:tetratricopeptide (TPR) repeat protein
MSLVDISQDKGDNTVAKMFYDRMLTHKHLENEIRGVLHYKIGLIYKAREDYSTALEHLTKAIELLPPTITAGLFVSTIRKSAGGTSMLSTSIGGGGSCYEYFPNSGGAQ